MIVSANQFKTSEGGFFSWGAIEDLNVDEHNTFGLFQCYGKSGYRLAVKIDKTIYIVNKSACSNDTQKFVTKKINELKKSLSIPVNSRLYGLSLYGFKW